MMTTTTVALCLSLLGSVLSTPAPTPSGCWKQWYCTGETSDTAYYCGDTAPCAIHFLPAYACFKLSPSTFRRPSSASS